MQIVTLFFKVCGITEQLFLSLVTSNPLACFQNIITNVINKVSVKKAVVTILGNMHSSKMLSCYNV